MKNFKLIKESWDRFAMNEEEAVPNFMAIRAPIKEKIGELITKVDDLIEPGVIFFDTETMGLQAVKPGFNSKVNEAIITGPVQITTPGPGGEKGQKLTEIAAAYITKDEILKENPQFPKDKESISHSRITFSDEEKVPLINASKNYTPISLERIKEIVNEYNRLKKVDEKQAESYISGQRITEFDERKYFNLVRPKISFKLEKETGSKPSEEQIKDFYKANKEEYEDQRKGTLTPHELLLMTAFFGSKHEVLEKIASGEAKIEDFLNLNVDVLKQPSDTEKIGSEGNAIAEFYNFVESKSASPIVAQNAGFDQGFISGRAKLYGLEGFDSLGLSERVKDTLNLARAFRNYLNDIVTAGENAKAEVRNMLSAETGKTPEELISILTTKKGAATISQGPMASALDVKATRWHTAIADIEMLFLIFSKMIFLIKEIEKLDKNVTLSNAASKKPKKKTDLEEGILDKIRRGIAGAALGASTALGGGPSGTPEMGVPAGIEASAEQTDYSGVVSLINYLNSVIAMSEEAIKAVDAFDKVITEGKSSGSISESKKVSKKPLKENRTITIRIGK